METLTNPRPKHNDDAIIRIAAEKLLPDVMGWLGDAGIPENEVLEDLAKAMRWNSDGYKIAKDLDLCEPDAALVEILDAAGRLKSFAREKACAEWVIANGLECPELGAKVTSITRPADGVGTVSRNWPDGRSTVAFHSAGHVTDGLGCHGFILEWENLIPWMNNQIIGGIPSAASSSSEI